MQSVPAARNGPKARIRKRVGEADPVVIGGTVRHSGVEPGTEIAATPQYRGAVGVPKLCELDPTAVGKNDEVVIAGGCGDAGVGDDRGPAPIERTRPRKARDRAWPPAAALHARASAH